MMKAHTFWILLCLTACSSDVRRDINYRSVCTPKEVASLTECVERSKVEDQGKAERFCRERLCYHQEAWLQHREYRGFGVSSGNSYEVPCSRATAEGDREACALAGYVESEEESRPPDPYHFAESSLAENG